MEKEKNKLPGVYTQQDFLSEKFHNEDQFTASTNRYINNNYPHLRGFYAHIPNESQHDQHHKFGSFSSGDRHRIRNAALGVLPGFPDFEFVHPEKWYLELKMPGQGLNKNQAKLHDRWLSVGIEILIAYTAIQVCSILTKKYGMPLFGRPVY